MDGCLRRQKWPTAAGDPPARIARRLRAGARLAVVAPAGPFDRALFAKGVRALEAMGFDAVFDEDVFAARGFLAGSDEHRAAALQRRFEDPAVDGIICARGGYGCLRVLSLLDYERIAAHPKAVIGFSDVTALHAALDRHCGLVTFHGPLVTTLAEASAETRTALWAAVAGDRPLEIRCDQAVVLRPGRAAGTLCGGNLTTLCHLTGTPFAPAYRHRVLFLEDCGEAPYRIDRMLTQMKIAGVFEGLAGLVLGSFSDCGAIEEVWRVVADVLGGAGIPILAGVEAGHSEPNLTLPLGLRVVLDADARELRFESAATADPGAGGG
jgi:muramoyltetrapeptide carboxypeptidase